MTRGGVPGRRIGTLDAADVNVAIRRLAKLVAEEKLPPKVLVVHRFHPGHAHRHGADQLDPRVSGGDRHGRVRRLLAQGVRLPSLHLTLSGAVHGFKLFYKNDRLTRAPSGQRAADCPSRRSEVVGCGDDGLMTPRQVLHLYPQPLYIQYQ